MIALNPYISEQNLFMAISLGDDAIAATPNGNA